MTHLAMRVANESGEVIDFVPDQVFPLAVSDLRIVEIPPLHRAKLHFSTKQMSVDGVEESPKERLSIGIEFHESPLPYALVPGGWLPVPFVVPQKFLVDRNVVATFKKIRNKGSGEDSSAFGSWTAFWNEGTPQFNPLPFAYEAGLRRAPSYAEFVSAFDEGANELRLALPNVDIVRFDKHAYEVSYEQLQQLRTRNLREESFLLEVIPMVLNRLSGSNQHTVVNDILTVADKKKLQRQSFVVLAALSCVFEDASGSVFQIGRGVLKPKARYADAAAYNAISDLRNIELAAVTQAIFPNEPFALCTNDRAVAYLWSALAPRAALREDRSIGLTFDISTELLPRLNNEEIAELKHRLVK